MARRRQWWQSTHLAVREMGDESPGAARALQEEEEEDGGDLQQSGSRSRWAGLETHGSNGKVGLFIPGVSRGPRKALKRETCLWLGFFNKETVKKPNNRAAPACQGLWESHLAQEHSTAELLGARAWRRKRDHSLHLICGGEGKKSPRLIKSCFCFFTTAYFPPRNNICLHRSRAVALFASK